MKRVLFVCTGNTCRSPMAEAVLRARCEQAGAKLTVSSAGLYADEGAPMSSLAVLALQDMGVPAHDHCARQLTHEIARQADLILTMTESHLSQVLRHLPQYAAKVYTLKAFAYGSGDDGRSNDISDPFGGSLDTYRRCVHEIAECVAKAWEKLQEE